jgi:hypothetical protein
MAATYPSTLPGPQREGQSIPLPDHIKTVAVQGGPAIRKRLRNKYLVRQGLEFIFSSAQLATWAAFVKDTLDYTGSFNLTTFGLDGIAEREVWLSRGKYTATPLSNGHFIVDLEITYIQGTIIDDCTIDIIDGGDTSSTHADDYDGGDTASSHADDIDGGDTA